MKIETIPEAIDDLLYDWQRHEILKKVGAPIAAIGENDPLWEELDSSMTGGNNVMHMNKDGEVACSIHELGPGLLAAWVQDDYPYLDPEEPSLQAILLNRDQLAHIRKHGLKDWGWGQFLRWLEQ